MATAANPANTAQGRAPMQPNVYNQSAQAYTGALGGTAAGMAYNPQTLAQTNLQPYMNPYTQNVVNTTLGDINRMRQMGLNDVGAQATRAGAFGGSRQGVAEAETNRAAMDAAARAASGLYQQGFTQARDAAQQDIANQMAANEMRLGAASQLGSLSNLGFGFGQQLNKNLSQQGALQQGVQQALIDAARSQYEGFTGAPGQSLQYPLAAIGGVPSPMSETTTKQPGLFNFLSLALGL